MVAKNYSIGSQGAIELAEEVVRLAEQNNNKKINYLYELNDSYVNKINTIAKQVYHAGNVEISSSALNKLKKLESEGYGNLPICIAKTQYSFSDDATKLNAPTNHTLHVTDVGFLKIEKEINLKRESNASH